MRWIIALCLTVAASVSVCGQWVGPLSRDVNGFAMGAYARLAETGDNFVFSPLSLNFAMRMVEEGARRTTSAEMAAVLNPAEGAEQIGGNVRRYQASLNGNGACELTVANSVWVAKGYGLLPAFVDTLKLCYGAACGQLNFATRRACRLACAEVNRWVAGQTDGKITNLLNDNMLNANTRMVLVNAINFKCQWMSKFKPKNSSGKDFYSIDGTTKNITFMSQTGDFDYCETADFKAVEMPYEGGRFSMLIVMPADGQFGKFESELTSDFVGCVVDSLDNEHVALSMPKFNASSSVDFGQILKAMGMVEAFGGAADFSGMSGKQDLQLSKVVQKTVVEVDESGTEAASATAATMMVKSAYFPKTKHFDIDHPFVYFIRDTQTNIILFAGRYVKAQ
ncbi:MAG: serpin family protein [Salinivirgaceae bacterium]|nr:serpin family protein [Salinivirgaceae bacterium]